MKKSDYHVYIFCFMIAFFTSLFNSFISIHFVELGYSDTQIGILCALLTLGNVFQPIFGYLIDGKFDIKKIFIFNLIILFFVFCGLFVFEDVLAVAIFILLYSIFYGPLGGLIDNIIISYSKNTNKNFGIYRGFFALVYGFAIFMVTPIIYLYGVSSFFIISAIAVLVTIIVFARKFSMDTLPPKNMNKQNYRKSFIELCKNKNYLLFTLFAVIFMCGWGIKSSYQSILVYSHTTSTIYLAVISIICVVMEFILFPQYTKISNKVGYKNLLYIGVFSATLLTFVFSISDNIYVVIIASILHGVVSFCYIPTIVFVVKDIVNIEVSNSALLLSSTLRNLVTFIFSIVVITPIFTVFDVQAVYFTISIVMIVSLIPLYFVKIKK